VSTFFSAVTAIRLEVQREINALSPYLRRSGQTPGAIRSLRQPKAGLKLR
jgi:hypothetical protein